METGLTTTADDVRIAYDVSGSGEPLVLVHGITEQRRMWDPLVPALAAEYQVINVDLRGHGESSEAAGYSLQAMADDVFAVLRELGVAPVPSLVGHSLGGIVVSAYASAYEARTVINIDQPLALAAFKDQLGRLEPMLRSDQFEGAMGALFGAITGDRISAEERARIEGLRTPKQDVVLGVWSIIFDSSVEELEDAVNAVVGGVTAPYLSLHGADLGTDYSDWLTSRIPSATIEVWDGVGHYPHLVEQDRFIARALQFIGNG